MVENMVRQYDGFRLEIPRWEIPDQGITALCGPSGAGKTTVFRMLIGLEDCPGLKWSFQGEDLAQLPVPERRLGVVFQSLELFPHMTAEENILFAAEARRLSQDESRDRLQALAQDLRMSSYLKRKAAVLSGGEAQRVALARAVITRPLFLFLDEPFSSLDAELRSEARALVKRVIEKFQFPTLLITHDEEDLQAMANTVVRLKDGRLL
ncbi:MAG: ATP-binding cassette domain-containing protein [Bdellovibrionales bacterium]|nr:ATP-binding cassette domain-containing protein [Bdellovibrionales bacterium]